MLGIWKIHRWAMQKKPDQNWLSGTGCPPKKSTTSFFKCEALLHGAFSARTRARHRCGHLGLNVNNSRIYGPIFFKIYTLILTAILRYHIKNHCNCFSRFVFIQFLIRSLFEKKNPRILDFRLTFDPF